MRAQSLLGTLLTCAAVASLPAHGLEVGERFPELVLPSLEGKPLSIASFRGQKVALHVWASW